MGCGASSTSAEPSASGTKASSKVSTSQEQPVHPKQPISVSNPESETPSSKTAKESRPMSLQSSSTKGKSNAAIAAPAPGVKHVRAAYKGKGWAPPSKQWESNKTEKGDKTRIEIEDEWDDDGNLKRTTTKHITTADWKKSTETTVEIIPAAEAEKMGLGRK